MRKLRRLWRALESLPGLSAERLEWRRLLDGDWEAAQAILRPTGRLAESVWCPSPGGDGCPRRVVHHADGSIVAACGDRPRRCERLSLSLEDIVILSLDFHRLAEALSNILSIDGEARPVPGLRRTFRLGEHAVTAGGGFPVFLSIQPEREAMTATAAQLCHGHGGPFALVAPTDDLVDFSTREKLNAAGAALTVLEEIVGADDGDRLIGLAAPEEIFADLRQRILGDRKVGAPEFRFPTPPGACWEDVSVRFITQHQVHIRAREETGVYEHTQMGMANLRNGQPTKQWELLQTFAEARGELTWQDAGADNKNQKRRELLGRRLRNFFGIDDDPFEILPSQTGWRARFTIIPEE